MRALRTLHCGLSLRGHQSGRTKGGRARKGSLSSPVFHSALPVCDPQGSAQLSARARSRELLEKLFELVAYAPTAHNAREVGYLVLNGREKVERLLQTTVRLMEEHCMYPNHTRNVRNGHDTLFRGAPCLILVHAPQRILSETDCAIAASYLELAMPSLGLGSCWAGMLIEACAYGLPKGLELPKGHKLYAALMVGIPTVSYVRVPSRSLPAVTWA